MTRNPLGRVVPLDAARYNIDTFYPYTLNIGSILLSIDEAGGSPWLAGALQMAVLSQYTYVFAITTAFAALDAWNIGANDVANSFATSVSSRSLTLKQAMALAAVCEFSGSATVGSRVADTIRTKIIDPRHYESSPAVLLLAMMCTVLASSTFLTVATRYGMPVSTTHAMVGGLVGTASASIGITKVNWAWDGVAHVFATWAVAPGIAGCLGALLFLTTKYSVLVWPTAVQRALYSIPFYTFLTVASITMLIVWEGIQVVELSTAQVLLAIFLAASGAVLLQILFVMPYLWVRIVRQDWTLTWHHVFQGLWLLRRQPPPPTPVGFVKPQIKDYYRGHLNAEELHCMRASETLLQSVQTDRLEHQPKMDKDDDAILPSPALLPMACTRTASSSDDGLIPPRPPGPSTSLPVVAWKVNRFLLRGIEQDIVGMQKRNAVLKWDIEDMHSRATRFDNRAEYMYSSLQILTAAAASFTHGANDVSNAIAPFTTAYQVWSTGAIPDLVSIPIWVLCFGGGAIVIGLLTYGYHVMRTLGNRLTLISPSRGFCMELASAITVLMATRLSLPVSTTQCITGATVGVGLANGDWRCINPRLVAWIYLGWIITVPVTALISGCLMGMILYAPNW